MNHLNHSFSYFLKVEEYVGSNNVAQGEDGKWILGLTSSEVNKSVFKKNQRKHHINKNFLWKRRSNFWVTKTSVRCKWKKVVRSFRRISRGYNNNRLELVARIEEKDMRTLWKKIRWKNFLLIKIQYKKVKEKITAKLSLVSLNYVFR